MKTKCPECSHIFKAEPYRKPKPRVVTTNPKQRLFVIPAGDGYSCWGFENCFREATAMAQMLGEPLPKAEELGTLPQYEQARRLQRLYGQRPDLNQRTWFDAETPEAVKAALESARINRTRVRLFLGDQQTGRSWLDEHDVVGHIGRSMGPMRVPLLVPPGEDGGGAILTACVIRLTETRNGRDLYRHPGFHLPELKLIEGEVAPGHPEYKFGVEGHANFKTREQRDHWVGFMRGDIFTPPKA